MMGSIGNHGVKPANITTGNTASDAIYIQGANRIAIEIPTFSVGVTTATANVYVQGAQTSSATFRRIQIDGVYSAASGIYDWETPSSIGNKMVICMPAPGFEYIKIELSNAATAIVSCNVHMFT